MKVKGAAKWYLFCLLILTLSIVVISGCSSGSPSWRFYEGSAVEKSFPVPKEANKAETASNRAKLEYVRYSVPGLTENSKLPAAYEKEIEAWGWTEDEEEKTASTRTFTKNQQVIQLSMQKNAFVLYVSQLQETAAAEVEVDRP